MSSFPGFGGSTENGSRWTLIVTTAQNAAQAQNNKRRNHREQDDVDKLETFAHVQPLPEQSGWTVVKRLEYNGR